MELSAAIAAVSSARAQVRVEPGHVLIALRVGGALPDRCAAALAVLAGRTCIVSIETGSAEGPSLLSRTARDAPTTGPGTSDALLYHMLLDTADHVAVAFHQLRQCVVDACERIAAGGSGAKNGTDMAAFRCDLRTLSDQAAGLRQVVRRLAHETGGPVTRGGRARFDALLRCLAPLAPLARNMDEVLDAATACQRLTQRHSASGLRLLAGWAAIRAAATGLL